MPQLPGRSIRAEIADLARQVQSRTAAETPVQVDLITCDTRAEALALAALPPTPPPPTAARVRLSPVHTTAADYLAGQ